MKRSKHVQNRMNHRGITAAMIDLVYKVGIVDHKDRITLNKKAAEELLLTMQTLMKIVDKGGLELVEVEGTLVTAYRLDSGARGGRKL